MSLKKIYSESPEDEQWRILLTYTYTKNIERYFLKNGKTEFSTELLETISGSISQAKEYFDASKNSSLNISPLLLYYGASNLFYGIANLLSCSINRIQDHGMKVSIPSGSCMVGDIEITPLNPDTGAISVFNKSFGNDTNLCSTGKWSVKELFGSIPDILEDYLSCYEHETPYVIPVQIIKNKKSTVERIEPKYFERFSSIQEALRQINKFSENYLPVQFNEQMSHVILRPKMNHKEIGIHGLSSQKYFKLGHQKNGKLIEMPIEITMFMGLFSLGYLSRYKPEYWNPFVKNDISGEKLLVEKFLYYCFRILPNLALDLLNGTRICFVNEIQGTLDYSMNTTTEEIQDAVRAEIQKYFEIERMKLHDNKK